MRIAIQDLEKRFGSKVALNQINLTFESGTINGLIGRNGAGKSTLLRCITGFLKPTSGEVLFDGQAPQYHVGLIGCLPEERGLYTNASVEEQLMFFASLNGMDEHAARARINELIAKFELEEYTHAPLKSLSKGNKQKVQIITAIVHNPSLLILDEPFDGLDPLNRLLLLQEIEAMQKRGGTIIFSSHQLDDIEALCQTVTLMNKGNVILSEPIKELESQTSDIKAYLLDLLKGDNHVL